MFKWPDVVSQLHTKANSSPKIYKYPEILLMKAEETAGTQKKVNKSLCTARGDMTNSTQDTE